MPPTDAPALRVDDARKRYRRRLALDGLDLSVAAGEWVGLLGPNGAGKSTLLRAVAGLTRLDAGRIRFAGEDLEGDRRAARVGFVPQEIAIYPALTAEENLRVFGRLAGIAGAELEERVAWALGWTGLARRAGERAGTYSGGMQRRLNIACGVLHRPRVVLLDEPTVGVDPQGRQRIWEMLGELRRGGAALVQSTHELHEIEAVCDRMVIVDRGRRIAEGPVGELVARHLGSSAALELTLDRAAGAGLELDPALGAGLSVRGPRIEGRIDDPAAELAPLLEELHRAGFGVRDLHLERPGLEAVFSHLTGRELRE